MINISKTSKINIFLKILLICASISSDDEGIKDHTSVKHHCQFILSATDYAFFSWFVSCLCMYISSLEGWSHSWLYIKMIMASTLCINIVLSICWWILDLIWHTGSSLTELYAFRIYCHRFPMCWEKMLSQNFVERLRPLVGVESWDYIVLWKLTDDHRYSAVNPRIIRKRKSVLGILLFYFWLNY